MLVGLGPGCPNGGRQNRIVEMAVDKLSLARNKACKIVKKVLQSLLCEYGPIAFYAGK